MPSKMKDVFKTHAYPPIPPHVARELDGFIAHAQRRDGDPSARDPKKYVVAGRDEAGEPNLVWGPAGVLVLTTQEGLDGWTWADDLPDMDRYYTDEYHAAFPQDGEGL